MSLLKLARPTALVAALAFLASGCLKSEETITIYPDGSGKIQMKATFLGMMAQMIKMGGQGGPMGAPGGHGMGAKQDPFEMIKKSAGGKVFWTDLKAEDGPQGEYMLSGTGYFEDVSQVKREKGSISFTKDAAGDGYVLEVEGELPDEFKRGMPGGEGGEGGKTPEEQQMAQQMKEMMKGMITGFGMKLNVVMPGAVKTVENMTSEGRTATFALTDKDLLAMMDNNTKPPTHMKVVCGAAADEVSSEMAAFKAELEAAKLAAEKEAAEKAAKKAAEAEKKRAGGAAGKAEKKPEGGEKKPEGGAKKPEGGEGKGQAF